MQLEVLALFQKELREQVELIKSELDKLSEQRSAGEISRAFHSMKGAASLLKIDTIKSAAGWLEKEVNSVSPKTRGAVEEAIQEFLAIIEPVLKKNEEELLDAIQELVPKISALEKMMSPKGPSAPVSVEGALDKRTPSGEHFFYRLKELTDRFKQHLSFCESNFEDLERVTLLEELAAEIRDLGKTKGIQIVVEAGRALNLCFFAVRKKLLGWTRGHFDLIQEIVEFLFGLAGESSETCQSWLIKKKSNVETCVNIILAISNEATQFIYYEDLKGRHPPPYPKEELPEEGESFASQDLDEKDQRFVALFLTELRDQIKDFEGDLLTLEKNPDDTKTASKLMRASHSLKGASKAVGFHALTRLAHSMEDLFSLVQKGEGVIIPEAIDVLLKAVDILHVISKVESGHLDSWLMENKTRIDQLLRELSAAFAHCTLIRDIPSPNLQEGREVFIRKSAAPEPPAEVKKALVETFLLPMEAVKEESRFLRVSLPHINHLMGLAGEFLVEAKSLDLFERSLGRMKTKALKVTMDLSRIKEKIGAGKKEESIAVADSLLAQGKSLSHDISKLMQEFDRFARASEALSSKFYQEMVESRMRPFSEGTEFLPRLIRDLCKQLSKKADLQIVGKNTLVDREILEKLESPLTHLVRNAIDHGIESTQERALRGKCETGLVKVEATHRDGALVISVYDDGSGIDLDQIKKAIIEKKLAHESILGKMDDKDVLKYLFHPGFSTSKEVTEISGRGIGLNVVQSTVEQLGGRVAVKDAGGALFEMILPLTLSIIRALLVLIDKEPYAFPLARIKKVLYVEKEDLFTVEGREYFKDGGKNVALFDGLSILGLQRMEPPLARIPVVMLSDGISDYGIQVDVFLGEKEIAIHELDKKIGKMDAISAGSFMEDGYPLLILDTEGIKMVIERQIAKSPLRAPLPPLQQKDPVGKKRILIVDDSAIVRRVLTHLLSTEGFVVDQAENGQEGLRKVNQEKYDLLISDIDMPEMSGIELIHKIRGEFKESELPVILLSYKDEGGFSEAMKPLKVDHFFSKSQFQDRVFVDAVKAVLKVPNDVCQRSLET